VLINNAGVMDIGPTPQMPVEIGQRMLDVCLSAPLRLTRAVLPSMIERKRGTIVQVASVASLVTPPGGTWYGAAKAGLSAFSEALRNELRGTGVNVLTVYPGPVATPLADGGYAAYGKSRIIDAMPEGTPDELAERVQRAVDQQSARLFYPRAYRMTRWFPRLMQWFTVAFTPELNAEHTAKLVALPSAKPAAQLPAQSATGSKAVGVAR
jgi:short-subunit dehydrogenase